MLVVGMLKNENVIGKDLTSLPLFNPQVHMIAGGGEGARRFGTHTVSCTSAINSLNPPSPPAGGLFCLCSLTEVQSIMARPGHLGNQKVESAGSQRGSGLQRSL